MVYEYGIKIHRIVVGKLLKPLMDSKDGGNFPPFLDASYSVIGCDFPGYI
jgi:hypothetical protein